MQDFARGFDELHEVPVNQFLLPVKVPLFAPTSLASPADFQRVHSFMSCRLGS